MMKHKQLFGLIIGALLLCSASCKKNDTEPQLPPVTQTGENTFGCLVNGEVWLPQKGMMVPPYGTSNNQNLDKRWMIDCVNQYGTILLTICQDSVLNGSSTFSNEDLCSFAKFIDRSTDESLNYITDGDTFNGKVTILKFDTEEEIIAGTFWFDAVSDNGQQIQIRDGRFDLKFTEYEP